ncbi:MAG: GatB/YqeY domain-containing protein [Syntrophobacteraceae bacterium]|nr:GatB/YqeY domain-containing protein [Syntrophobacteraceae bacterium]
MSLKERIEQELKDAILEKNENRRNAIRLLLTALKVKEKEFRRIPDELEIQQVIASQIKQRRDSVEQFTQAGRQDLARKEEEEILVLQKFMPEALEPEELQKLVDEVIAEVGARSVKEMGKVMKALMPRVGGRADGKRVNEIVRARLES